MGGRKTSYLPWIILEGGQGEGGEHSAEFTSLASAILRQCSDILAASDAEGNLYKAIPVFEPVTPHPLGTKSCIMVMCVCVCVWCRKGVQAVYRERKSWVAGCGLPTSTLPCPTNLDKVKGKHYIFLSRRREDERERERERRRENQREGERMIEREKGEVLFDITVPLLSVSLLFLPPFHLDTSC